MKRKQSNSYTRLAGAILIGSFVIAVAILVQTMVQLAFNQANFSQTTESAIENISYVKITDDPVQGNKNAPITVIEYTDFECPVCKQSYDVMLPKLRKVYIATNKVKFVFKSLPIEELHKTAFKKTEAAFCARDQGGDTAFFHYHDAIFNNFRLFSENNLTHELSTIAQQTGLNPASFLDCLNKRTHKDSINKEIIEAQIIGSQGTPTWLIGKSNGGKLTHTVKINGLADYAVYQTVINELLKND